MPRRQRVNRSTQLGKRKEVVDQLLKHFSAVERGFNDQADRSDDNIDYWDLYNSRINNKQKYTGVFSNFFIPLTHNAIEGLKTRFLNQLFPISGRYVDVTTEDDVEPHAVMSLLEQYVDLAELKTKVVPRLLVSGEVEGQYTVQAGWATRERHTVSRETKPITIGGIEHPDLGEVEEITTETVEVSGPWAAVIPDSDVLILPATAETIDDALAAGGSVTTLCRWSESRIEDLIKRGEIDSDLSAELLVQMKAAATVPDTKKHLADTAGIKANGKYALIYRSWKKIKLGDDERLVLAYYAGDGMILGCRLCPYWCDRCDILSKPLRPEGVAKGISPLQACADMQYMANDFINMGLDSGVLTINPVIMTDPEKNPRVGSMVLDSMAVWEVSPRDTQMLQVPALYQHAFNIVQAAERYINATLGVNAAMLPQQTGVPGRKRNQAEVAMEQQVDLLSTAVEVSQLESGILSPLMDFWAQLDAQYRDTQIVVRTSGRLGVEAEMQTVPVLQIGRRWRFRWFGVEAARTAQQIQQQIALLNVMRPMTQDPAVAQAGYRLNLVPILRTATENAFGPRLAPEIFENVRDQLSVDPELENEMLAQHMMVPTSAMDDDAKHLKLHLPEMQKSNDAVAQHWFQQHIAAHQRQMQMKAAAQAMQNMAKQMQQPGQRPPGGAPAAPGGRPPMPGGQVAGPRQIRQAPGAVPADQLRNRGIVQIPRRAG